MLFSSTFEFLNVRYFLTLFEDYKPFLLSGRCWKVRFIGESVDDCGGGYSDSIAEICDELQSELEEILIPTPNTSEIDNNHSKVYLITPITEKYFEEKAQLFKFLGNLIGSALRQGSPLALRIQESMWKVIKESYIFKFQQ